MSKKKRGNTGRSNPPKQLGLLIGGATFLVVAVVVAQILRQRSNTPVSATPAATSEFRSATQSTPPPATNSSPSTATNTAPLEINQAVMVTVELDFGGQIPSIAEGLTQIERRYQPADGQGRTFAILDAYGGPTANNKLHMSMHVSTEKAGKGLLIFKRTGEVLWESVIRPGTNTNQFSGKNLLIYIDNGEKQNKMWTIDGSSSPTSILDALIKEQGVPVRDLWPDGTDREFTYLYSACGCPVKAMVRRQGDVTVRTSDQPVLFPDDPAALQVISRLMRW